MKYLSIFILSFILIVSCSDNSTDADNSSKKIMPLAVGNSWTYTRYKYHSIKSDSLYFVDTVKVNVSSKVTIDGVDWFYLQSNGIKDDYVYTNKSDGLWRMYAKDTNSIDPTTSILILKYPTVVNDTFTVDNILYKTLTTDDYVFSPAGRFDCIKYIQTKLAHKKSSGYYYAPGKGKILTEEISGIDLVHSDTVFIKTILVDYELK